MKLYTLTFWSSLKCYLVAAASWPLIDPNPWCNLCDEFIYLNKYVYDFIVGFNCHTCTNSAIPKPTIKTNNLYYKYNTIADVVNYNPQSILETFPINSCVFRSHALTWVVFSLPYKTVLNARHCGF